MQMNTISLKVPDTLASELAAAANRRHVSKSELIREAIRVFLQGEQAAPAGGALSRITDLVGAFPGPSDLSVNKKYLEGLGE